MRLAGQWSLARGLTAGSNAIDRPPVRIMIMCSDQLLGGGGYTHQTSSSFVREAPSAEFVFKSATHIGEAETRVAKHGKSGAGFRIRNQDICCLCLEEAV